jgi:hypothetical protein
MYMNLKEVDVKMWTGFSWLSIGLSGSIEGSKFLD